MKKIALVLLIIVVLATKSNGQPEAVFYFVDAVSADTISSGKTYFYSFPVKKSPTRDFSSAGELTAFKRVLKEKHGMEKFSSSVVRTNDSYDETRNLIALYTDKYRKRGYTVVAVESLPETR